MAFRGNFEHSLDAKNRLTIPSKLRDQLGDDLVIARALEPCAAIWNREGFEAFTQGILKDLNPLSEEARSLSLYFNASSFDSELDKAGRVMLPPPLMDYAGLKKDVTVIGNSDHIQLWEPTAWQEHAAAMTTNLPVMVANIVNAG